LTSFDPVYTIGFSIGEVLRLSKNGLSAHDEIDRLLREVGLSPRFRNLRPHAVSGGELQRAAIARALSVNPELVVLDEPTSALDMSIQGQVLSLLTDLQGRHGLSYLLATHDLRVVEMVAHRVAVMYLGQIVEIAPTRKLFASPLHPYTQGLMYARNLGGRTSVGDRTIRIRGTLRYPESGYVGCRLVGRCPLAVDQCREPQTLTKVGLDHLVRCWKGVTGATLPVKQDHADSQSPVESE
jgi:oligopeptide/dipeptide ABC transporter ATP-binding protein